MGCCSSCTDITHDMTIDLQYVKRNYIEASLGNTSLNATFFPNIGLAANTNISVLRSMPSSLSVTYYPGTLLNLTAIGTFQQPKGSGVEYQIEMIVGKQFQLLDPAIGKPPSGCDAAATNSTWYCRGYRAASCSLAPCVRAFICTVEAGQLHETEVSASADWGHYVQPPAHPNPPNAPTTVPIDPSQIYFPYLGIFDTMCLNDF